MGEFVPGPTFKNLEITIPPYKKPDGEIAIYDIGCDGKFTILDGPCKGFTQYQHFQKKEYIRLPEGAHTGFKAQINKYMAPTDYPADFNTVK